ncbi:hypothetical protein COB21_04985 [Candidatus Aerophobetes bacterium]|uniref:Uncharacterized protein n=1 Tax=Aerophobetes bacterium TaxID=2030807 RepID=A0A2A4X013_UNCAE|nr:MAG: hypothetical protein COB21_04985 [Candidatus Aerophobetes bacterium]
MKQKFKNIVFRTTPAGPTPGSNNVQGSSEATSNNANSANADKAAVATTLQETISKIEMIVEAARVSEVAANHPPETETNEASGSHSYSYDPATANNKINFGKLKK